MSIKVIDALLHPQYSAQFYPGFRVFDPTAMAVNMNYSKAVMSNSYVIQWKSTINGRSGRGTKLFDFEEAQGLAQELNQEYPAILHEPVQASSASQPTPPGLGEPVEQGQPEPAEQQAEAGSEARQVVHDPDPVMSFE